MARAKSGSVKKFTGILRLNVFAIGGETIGIELETDEGKYDLDMIGVVNGMKDKKVIVTGRLEKRTGTERTRSVIVAEEIVRDKT